jgi:uncharacterized protein (TIGR03435 family)
MQTSPLQIRRGAQRWAGIVAVTAALLLCGAATGTAQAQEAAKPQPMKAMPKQADPDWEVATVKPSDPTDVRGQHINFPGRHVMLLDTTVEQFLLLGYSVQQSQVPDLPDWVKTTRWDVDGVPDVEGIPSLPQVQALIRKILAERFGLQLHHEQRELSVFALTVAKGGPKLVLNTSDPNGWMDQQNGNVDGRHVESLKNASMAELALILQFHVDRPVVNQTGLTGRYDLQLQWAPDDPQTTAPDAPPGLFTAIREQIGLKLERVKAPADVLIIDKLEKPGAN